MMNAPTSKEFHASEEEGKSNLAGDKMTWQRFGGSILPRGIGDQKDDIMASAVARSAEIVIDFDNIISQRFTIIFK